MITPLRCGLVGTGHWAQTVHAPALASADGLRFSAVWGRNRAAAQALAAGHGAAAFADLDAFLDAVDLVAFSVPPDVQSDLAPRAARAGKHLLLEKPIALTVPAADALAEAVAAAGVASVVFFTARFEPQVRAWLAQAAATGSWSGGRAAWFGTALAEGDPFNTPWRRRKGGLWDLAPHVLSVLWPVLGPVTAVTADAGRADLAHLIFHHAGGATSTATVTLSAPAAAAVVELSVWGDAGRSAAPLAGGDPVARLRLALAELAEGARSGATDHPCDVRFGRDIVRVLAAAEHQLDARPAPVTPPPPPAG